MSHLSVIVTDGSAIAQRVQEVVADWTRAGLVGESVWVCPEDVTPTAGPPQVLATVIGPAGADRADLFHAVGVRRLDTVRLVVAQFIVTGDDQARVLPELGRTLEGLLESVRPRPMLADSGQGTSLRKTNVIIPASGICGISKEALLPGWDANSVVAAEDRPDLDRASVFVREGGNYTGHAAAAIASVAALWSGIDQGCLDVLDTDSTTTDTDVAVVRHTVRAIVRSNDVQELADAACDWLVSNPSAPAHNADWARPALQAGSVVDSVFGEIMETGDWAARKYTPEPERPTAQRRFGAGFHEAAAHNVQLYGLGLKAIAGMGRRAVEHAGTWVLVGRHGDYVVRFHPSSSGSIVSLAQEESDLQTETLRQKMLIEEAGSVEAPNAATWAYLRRSSFGLIDGSQLPGEYQVAEIAGKPQLLPPSSVVPNPTFTFQKRDGGMIRACDAESAAEHLLALKDAAGEPAIAPTSEPGPDAPGADVDGEGELLAGDAEADDAQNEVETTEDHALQDEERKRAKEELAALETWIALRKDALMWRIYDGTALQAAQSSEEAHRASVDATKTDLPPAEALRRSQRKLSVSWSILGLAFAAILSYLWLWQYRVESISGTELTKRIAGVVLIALLLGVFFNHLYYRAVCHFKLMVEKTLASRRRAAGTYVVAQREARRFQLLASRLNDWAEIIASVLHRPWAPQPGREVPIVAEESVTHLPAAVAIAARPQQTSDISLVAMTRVIQVLTPRGWASQAFEDALDAYESNVRSARSGGHLAADLDTLTSPTSPLGLLRAFFFLGEAGMYATALARERIEQALTDGELELPPQSVRRVGEYAHGEAAVSDARFLGGLLHPAIRFAGDIWTSTGEMNLRNEPDKSAAWMPRGAEASQAASLVRFPATGDVAMRVDISCRCDISDLRMFVPEAPVKRDSSDPAKGGDF